MPWRSMRAATGPLTALPACRPRNGAQEVAAGLHFADMGRVLQHFACQDLLALDDADRLWGLPQAWQAFAELLLERRALGLRTLLTATLYPASPHNPQPLCDLLAQQTAVRLH